MQRGEPVVMLHGIGTGPGVWDGWLPALAGRHEIVRPALRGLDGRVTPPDPGALLDAVIGDVLASIPSGRRAHLVGESTGGTVMLTVALRHPQHVASVTLVNAPLRGGGTSITERWAALFAEGQESWSAEMMKARFASGVLDPGTWEAFEIRQRRTDPSAALALSAMLGDLDPTKGLPDLQVGLLALLPTASPFIDPLLYQRLLERAPDHELRIFHGAQHGLVFSHAAECSALLAVFLDRRELP
jgi:pimeloyl-ACP methyl ester carboxylesterase